MAKKRKNKKVKVDGELYTIKIWVGNDLYQKIGYTKRTARCRLVEIGMELMEQLQYWPKMQITNNKVIANPQEAETELLELTRKYMPTDHMFTFSGWSELRVMCPDKLQQMYDECISKKYEVAKRELITW